MLHNIMVENREGIEDGVEDISKADIVLGSDIPYAFERENNANTEMLPGTIAIMFIVSTYLNIAMEYMKTRQFLMNHVFNELK